MRQEKKWQVGLVVAIVLTGTFPFPSPSAAQLTPDTAPDRALGTIVVPLTPQIDGIGGGVQHGQNLFHSFQEFNVGLGRGVYFGNPAGVQNILTRVTGNNASNIQGTLGVLGTANLFLINPNGIIFGRNASLNYASCRECSMGNLS